LGLSEHTVDQLRLEVRSTDVLSGKPLSYAPPVRDENITTETLAAEIGRLIVGASTDSRHRREITVPVNPFVSVGDAIRFSGSEIDQPGSAAKIVVDRIVHTLKPSVPDFLTILHAGRFDPQNLCMRHLKDDPLDRLNGVVIGVVRDSQGIDRCDVAAAGSIFTSLARSPAVPPVKVGDAVIIAKPSRAAVHYLVVARSADIFGPERIVYV
jgi:hypothetical protein